ncbi:hypothetical protein [Nocardia africana]|uniref:Uncharacterized protein n=1 Tax=Nocardia africana TaxID=134964 RepID=A0ABW6NXL0_9NOCA
MAAAAAAVLVGGVAVCADTDYARAGGDAGARAVDTTTTDDSTTVEPTTEEPSP